jgi:hypothetical protein
MNEQPAPLQMTSYLRIPEPEITPLWNLYQRAFGRLATTAASRHVMDADLFRQEMADPRITKCVVSQGGAPVGLLTTTSDLDNIVWVSPDFYRARYPVEGRRQQIHYITNMLTDPRYGGREVFRMLTEAACRLAAGGVLGFDICRSNVERGFADAIRRRTLQLRGEAHDFQALDTQTFYGIDLTEPITEGVVEGSGTEAVKKAVKETTADGEQ